MNIDDRWTYEADFRLPGPDGDSYVWNCRECGALVLDRRLHNDFHDDMDALRAS